MRKNTAKALLKSGQPAVGTWFSLGNITAARFLARAGFDWLTVDIEHSLVGMENSAHIFGAVADAGGICLARVPSNRHDHIKRVLDNGAHGVVVPMVNTRQEAMEAVQACLYPPQGTRSVGGSVHALNWNAKPSDYYAKANDEILIVLQCEHIDAVKNFETVYADSRIDAIFVGPNDLMASMRDSQGKPPAPQDFEAALQAILAGCKKLGIPAGIHTFSIDEAQKRIREGWQFIAVASELKFMVDGAAKVVEGLNLKGGQELAKY
jgi:4-hydroxy-2-oxoheptanedioate aldolase